MADFMKTFKNREKKQNTGFESPRGGKPERKLFERKSEDARFRVDGSRPKVRDARLTNSELRIKSHESRLIFGVLPVLESLRANSRRIEKILIADGAREHRISEIIDLAKQNSILWQKMPRENLSKFLEQGANHQGVIAFTASADYADAENLLDEITSKQNSLSLILDGVEDPRNLGAILRVAECAGADGVFIPEHRAVGLTETVVKTSAGATEHLKIAKVKNLNRLIEDLKEKNIWVVGASGDAKTDYTDWDWAQSSALIMGSEGKGLHRLVAENCDVLVKIPMYGKIESLNVSVATGVILFEAVRQRQEEKTRKGEEQNSEV
jgi:23S rRNA (guanosine2251-2'-O)-methyltransferase